MEVYLNSEVQDNFLSKAKEEQTPIILYTTNGFQVRGTISDFDETVIVISSDDRKQLIYKHAISTIAPLDMSKEDRPTQRYNRYNTREKGDGNIL